MNNAPLDPEAEIFNQARQLPAERRAAFLSSACATDPALRQRIEELLRFDVGGDFLQNPAPDVERPAGPHSTIVITPAERPGDRIGRYKLLQQIGEGGCGVVFMAEQTDPVRRQVALKIVKLGMDTKQVIARFEAERQALALMDHPNIAKVLDAGSTQTGRPYFVMELVRGAKITDYCDREKLSTEERLELFIQVCHAVQHAHQKGIIHRDLKPSNVLVTLRDGVPVPKVIDFGIAKATTDQRLTDKTLFTAFEQFIGTPAYMSPEQAEMSELGIDTRTDIYSLGILLYELLTGKTPFDAQELMSAGLDAMRQTIRQREPIRPSTRLRTMVEGELTTTASQRHTEAPKLIHLIRGDLDWIVMKALEKDRSRRYETANGFGMDIRRFLNREPILARPPSNAYRFKKLVARNKLAFAAVAAVLAALITGLALATVGFLREKAANRRATAAEKQSRTAAAQSDQVAQFLESMIQGVGPAAARGRDTTMMREILDQTEQQMGAQLKDQPEVQARLCMTIAGVYDQLNDFAKAEALCSQAIQLRGQAVRGDDPIIASWLDNLGMVQKHLGDYASAEKSLRQALEMEAKTLPPGAPPIANSLRDLSVVLQARGNLSEAEKCLRDSLALARKMPPSDDQSTLETLCLNDLGLVLWSRGNLLEAATCLHGCLDLLKKNHRAETPEASTALGNLGLILWENGQFAEAETAQRQALALRIKMIGSETHIAVAAGYHNLSLVLNDEGHWPEAVTTARRAFEIETGIVGENHPEAILARKGLAKVLRARGVAETNLDFLRESLSLSPTDPYTADALAAFLSAPKLIALAPPAPSWSCSITDPGPDWSLPAFNADSWPANQTPVATARSWPRSEHVATPATNLWLRQTFNLSALPHQPIVFRVPPRQDAELFINGVAALATGWADSPRLVPCSAAARTALKTGPNLLALHCQDADGGVMIGAEILASPDADAGLLQVQDLLTQWLAQNPQRAELYAGRANLAARLARWADARADISQALSLSPAQPEIWLDSAALLLAPSDSPAFAELRQKALAQFANVSNPGAAAEISLLALLEPIAGLSLESAGALADFAAADSDHDGSLPTRQLAKALAELRRRRFSSAAEWARQASANAASRQLPKWTISSEKNLGAAARLVESMALRDSNHSAEAQDAFAQALALLPLPIPDEDKLHLGDDWAGRLVAEALWREAQNLPARALR